MWVSDLMAEGADNEGKGAPKGAPRVGAKYALGDELGRGGMGVVYAGEHRLLGQRVAIKVLRPELAAKPEALARFLREARAAASLRGPHVVRIYDVDRAEDGTPYLVMELLEGEPLDALLDRRKRLPVAEAVDYVLEACEAVAEAHAAGIVHRDLKPQNLFLTEGPDGARHVKVLDFGISKSMAAPDSARGASLTGPDVSLGSPEYMSPEQVRDAGRVDARTDLWSLGVILYELLTGRVPFEGQSVPHILALVLTATPPPLRAARADVPEGLEAAVARCLEREAGGRPADVAEVASLLAPFGGPGAAASAARTRAALVAGPRSAPGRLVLASPPDPNLEATEIAPAGPEASPAPAARRPRALGPWLAAAALLIGGGFLGWRSGRSPAPVATAPAAGPPSAPSVDGAAAPAAAREPVPLGPSTALSGASAASPASTGAGGLPGPARPPPRASARPAPRASARPAQPAPAAGPASARPRSLDDLGLLP
ncbi:MAG TPA: serine/threonine-protein kinase [Polyangiaceae bacterium]|nr:serine/threonine-protein kinase [Polyangiaceae bacterium]